MRRPLTAANGRPRLHDACPRMSPELTEVPGYSALAANEQLAVLEMRMLATLLGATAKEKMQLLARAASKRKSNSNRARSAGCSYC